MYWQVLGDPEGATCSSTVQPPPQWTPPPFSLWQYLCPYIALPVGFLFDGHAVPGRKFASDIWRRTIFGSELFPSSRAAAHARPTVK